MWSNGTITTELGIFLIMSKNNPKVLNSSADKLNKQRGDTQMHKYIETDDNELTREVDKYETIRWNKEGQRHRTAGPAVMWADGTEYWYYKDNLHRAGPLPAIIWADGSINYYHHGVRYYPETIQINGEEIII